MSINPFSSNEIKNLRELIEKNGWKINGTIDNFFRYSLKRKKIVLFTIKFPIVLPLRLNIPFEITNFRFSLAFQFWNLNQDTYVLILYLMKALRNLAISITLDHDFPLDRREQQLENILDLIIPDIIKNEKESTWLNRIRISIMNKQDKLNNFSDQELNRILNSLKDFGIKPSFDVPWDLKYGIPKIRTTETLLFSNEEKLKEFFIIEKGYLTYLKDKDYNKFYLRTFFETYSPYILIELFRDSPEFKLEAYIEKWIKFAREILNYLVEIIHNAKINPTEFIQFRPEKELIYNSPNFIEEHNNFPLSALSYESSIARELYPIKNDLFISPPTNFEVLESFLQYKKANKLIKNYRFEEAANILNNSLIVFNKNQQKKIVVDILLKLRKIANLLNHEDTGLNYLINALSVAKSGEIPIEIIMKVHYKLGKTYYKRKEFEEALNSYNIIINFLKTEDLPSDKEKYLGLSHLHEGLIYLEQENLEKAKINFKEAFLIGNDDLKVKLKYFLLRGVYYKKRGKLSLALKFLRAGLDIGEDLESADMSNFKIKTDLTLELSEFFLHYKKDGKKALHLLQRLEQQLPMKEISNIKRGVRCNLLLSDYYNMYALDREKSEFYLKQSQKLKKQLQTIGIS
ncbi:MAG: tetratricopeptide repeat protein [Candidatus Thorarchaeota archaeon]